MSEDKKEQGCNYTADQGGQSARSGREILVCEFCTVTTLHLPPNAFEEIQRDARKFQRYDQTGRPRRFLAESLARIAHVHGWTFVPCEEGTFGLNAAGYRACCPACREERAKAAKR